MTAEEVTGSLLFSPDPSLAVSSGEDEAWDVHARTERLIELLLGDFGRRADFSDFEKENLRGTIQNALETAYWWGRRDGTAHGKDDP